MSSWMGEAPVVATLLVASVLAAEAGLLIGVFLPSSSLVLGLGVLTGGDVVAMSVAVLSASTATVLGASLGHRAATRSREGAPPAAGRIIGLLPPRVRAGGDRLLIPLADAVGRRPVRAAAAAQFIAGARTLAPRVTAQANVPLAVMLRGTMPAALLWSSLLVSTGALAPSTMARLDDVIPMACVLVVGATAVLVHRRRRRHRGTVPSSNNSLKVHERRETFCVPLVLDSPKTGGYRAAR